MDRRRFITLSASLPLAGALCPAKGWASAALSSNAPALAFLRSLPFGLTHAQCTAWGGPFTPRPAFILSRAPITGLAGLSGKTIAAGGAGALIWQKLGARVLAVPPEERLLAIKAGTLDMAESDIGLDASFSPSSLGLTQGSMPDSAKSFLCAQWRIS